MKTKTLLTVIAFAALTLAFNACSSSGTKETKTEQTTEKVVYTCPMDPEVTSDKPGKCPKCGMDLVKQEKPAAETKTGTDTTKK